MNELPLFKITIDPEFANGEDLGIEMIAFTSKPAVKVKGMAFNSQEKLYFADNSKMRIVAPAMIPMDIYRNDDGDEYFVQFTAEEIEKIHSKFMSNLSNKDVFNIEHNVENKVPAYILEAWIVDDPNTDKSKTINIDVPKGTLMLTAQVTDDVYYNELVSNGQVGFSIEGFLGMKLSEIEQQFKTNINMKLPDGEHLIEGKIYVVKGGEIIEVKDAPTEEVVMETEVVEEEVTEDVEMSTEEVVEEEVATEEVAMAIDPTVDAEAILAIVTPFIDEKVTELLQVIADIKNMVEAKPEEEVEVELKETKLSHHERFAKFVESNK